MSFFVAGPPDLEVFGRNLSFGIVAVGESPELDYENIIGNRGGGLLTGTVELMTIEGADGAFSIVSGDTFSLGPGEVHTVRIRFAPPSGCYYKVFFIVTADNGDTNTGSAQVVGIGDGPVLLTITPPTNGSVTSDPPGIACGTDCTEIYDFGQEVVLTAMPTSGFQFDSWGERQGPFLDCEGQGNPCTLSLGCDTTISVNFTPSP